MSAVGHLLDPSVRRPAEFRAGFCREARAVVLTKRKHLLPDHLAAPSPPALDCWESTAEHRQFLRPEGLGRASPLAQGPTKE